MTQLFHDLFRSCSGLPLAGLGLTTVSAIVFLAARKFRVAAALLVFTGIAVTVTGVIAGTGSCVEVAGTCPSPLKGSDYYCQTEGGACKTYGLFSGTCKTKKGWIYDCYCDCE